MDKDRLSILDKVETDIRKEFGEEQIVDVDTIRSIPRWQISSPNIAYVLGGGMPKGRIIEMYGQESSGKSSIATMIGADIQRQDGFVVYVDAENSFDPVFAKMLGLLTDKEHFRLVQAESGEAALDIAARYGASGVVDYIIIDSVSALTPLAEIEGSMSDQQMGLQARMMSKAMRKMTSDLHKAGTTVVFVNQIRQKIGISYGNPNVTSGGNALKFYSSIRMEVHKVENLTRGTGQNQEVVGIKIRVKGVKNKTAPPFRKVEVDFYFDGGLDSVKEYVEMAITQGLIDKAASWFTLPNGDRVQGKDAVAEALRSNPEMFETIKVQVDEFMGMTPIEPDVEKPEEPKKKRGRPKKEKYSEDEIEIPVGETSA